MSRRIGEIELMDELFMLEQDGRVLTETWRAVSAAAARGDASTVGDILELSGLTDGTIQDVKRLAVEMVRAGMDVDDIGLNRCLALLFGVVNLAIHFEETVQAARRVVELQREVQAARVFH